MRRNCILAARRGDTAAANRAAELIGKHLNMFVDRKELQINFVDDSDEYLARILEIVNAKVIDHEPALQQVDSDGARYGSDDQANGITVDAIEETS